MARDAVAVALALDLLRASEAEPISLAEIATRTGYSPAHFQKLFTRWVGLSPAAYARASRAGWASKSLANGASVTEAVYAAGYSAPSRFYESGARRMGMTPSAWRNGGKGVTIRWAQVETSLDPVLVAATEKGVCRLSFGEGPKALAVRFPQAMLEPGDGRFAALCEQVIAAVEQPRKTGKLPLDVQGTAFQEAVWR